MSCNFSFCKVCPSRLEEVDTPIEQPHEYPQIDLLLIPQHVYRPSNVTIYSIGHLNCMHEREYYEDEIHLQDVNACFLEQLFLISHQLRFSAHTKATTLSLFVRCFELMREDAASIYYLLAVIHLAAKYNQEHHTLPQIIERGLGAKAQLIKPEFVIETEDEILDFLGFDFSFLTVFDFLDAYLSFAQLDESRLHFVRYMCFQLMADSKSYQFKPSYLAAACISKCLKYQNQVDWNQTLEFWSGKSVSDFAAETTFLEELLVKINKEGFLGDGNVIYKLYSKTVHQSVSAIKVD